MAINYYIFQLPRIPNVYCAFQGRSSKPADCGVNKSGNISFLVGDSFDSVAETRKDLFNALNAYGLNSWAECRQIHGDTIIEDPSETAILAQPDNLPKADGMMSSHKGLGLMIKTADCQPLFIVDISGKHIMALHIGWRGNRINFPGKSIIKFCTKYNLDPKNLIAVRGPSLGPTKAEFINFNKDWGDSWKEWFDEKSQCMDLWELTRWQLNHPGNNHLGIPYENMYGMDICTYLNSDYFFSYRKQHNTGRQASVIWIVK